MNLPSPPGPRYDQGNERRFRDAVSREDGRNYKRGQDIEIIDGRLIMAAPDGSQFIIGVDNAGSLTTTPR